METILIPFKIITSENCPLETVMLIPEVTHVIYNNWMTDEVKEYLEWDAKKSAIIYNIG